MQAVLLIRCLLLLLLLLLLKQLLLRLLNSSKRLAGLGPGNKRWSAWLRRLVWIRSGGRRRWRSQWWRGRFAATRVNRWGIVRRQAQRTRRHQYQEFGLLDVGRVLARQQADSRSG